MFKWIGKEINAILGAQMILIWAYDKCLKFYGRNNSLIHEKTTTQFIQARLCNIQGLFKDNRLIHSIQGQAYEYYNFKLHNSTFQMQETEMMLIN